MAERTLPGIGLKAYWPEGTDHWGDDNDINLRLLSALVQCGVINTVAAEPGSPADGDMYLLSGTANAKKIAIRDNGAWVYFAPAEGWWIYDKTANSYLSYDGAAWGAFSGGGDLADLGDVDLTTPPTDGQGLIWNDADSKWEAGDVGSGGGGGSSAVGAHRYWALLDILAVTPLNIQALHWNYLGTTTYPTSYTSSSDFSGSYLVANLLDDTGTYWAASQVPAWVIGDFTAPIHVDEVEIEGVSAALASSPYAFKVAYSDDGKNWTLVTEHTYPSASWAAATFVAFTVPTDFPGGGGGSPAPTQRAGRIWRLFMGIANRALTTNLIGFGEIQWYDASNTLLTGSGFAYAESEYNPGLNAGHAFNGSTSGDGWLAATDGRLGRSWIAYDFGADVTPDHVKLVMEETYAASWPLEVTHQFSVDGGVTWVTTDVWIPTQPPVANTYETFAISPV